ncbi:MAG: VOC family protein [Tepidiformaceae bacterium]
MISGLAGTTIFSEDYAKLVPFYRDTLGLSLTREEFGMAFFEQPGGPPLMLGTHSEISGSAKEPARQIPALLSDDIRGDYARLTSLGVKSTGEPVEQGPVTFVTICDPEGNLVNLVQFALKDRA